MTTTKPGSATFPFPGIDADVVDADGNSVPLGGGGYLVLKRPWPAMLRGIYGDPERYRQTYWSRFPGMYFAGDGAKRDEDGYLWLLGRVDDVMNVAGHRISTTEVESALVDHQSVAEAAVVGKKDEITGQAIFAFVILKADQEPSDALAIAAARARRDGHRADRPPEVPAVRAGPAQDPVGQDHAPPAARHRRGPGPRRHDDARRRGRRRDHPGELRRGGGVTCRSTS